MEINDTNKAPVKLGTTSAMAGKREEGEISAKSVMPNNILNRNILYRYRSHLVDKEK